MRAMAWGLEGTENQATMLEVAGNRYFVSWAVGTLSSSLLPCFPLQDALAGGHQQHD